MASRHQADVLIISLEWKPAVYRCSTPPPFHLLSAFPSPSTLTRPTFLCRAQLISLLVRDLGPPTSLRRAPIPSQPFQSYSIPINIPIPKSRHQPPTRPHTRTKRRFHLPQDSRPAPPERQVAQKPSVAQPRHTNTKAMNQRRTCPVTVPPGLEKRRPGKQRARHTSNQRTQIGPEAGRRRMSRCLCTSSIDDIESYHRRYALLYAP
ncbi:hypothetical protein K491DRAFT_678806 [Lophiostoma macrostomum CBS 122681]|uniref:Uncharacterized protein n=1 Tax=Lophiostoma macrostomum CBS 122681 TaxID=1314788 RepID=A0A6A6T736_9PLEO|nr:hypothetical protein K491DRAFT_678806 [Lophiostoma macrostomum CBS 122681]